MPSSLSEPLGPTSNTLLTLMTMATKKAAPTDDELLAQLDDLGTKPAARPSKSSTRAPRQGGGGGAQTSQTEQDLLAELGSLAHHRPASRPGTPSLKPNAPSTAGSRSPNRAATATPPAGRSSEEKSSNGQRKSGDSMRSFHQSFTPATTTTEESVETESQPVTLAPAPAPATGGGWWGGLLSTASAAVSQAQAAVKEIQKNEEAQKWAEQVRGNVGALRGIGMNRHPNHDFHHVYTFLTLTQAVI